MAQTLGVGVNPVLAHRRRLLTGKYGKDRAPDDGRVRDNQMYQVRYANPA